MSDREKIIAALENCSDPAGKCRDCPYEECERFEKSISEYPDELIRKAVELLKDQEPRVLTLEEVRDEYEVVWLETKYLSPTVCLFDNGESNVDWLYFVFGSDDSYGMAGRLYGKNWRCWSARPTDELREAVKWE